MPLAQRRLEEMTSLVSTLLSQVSDLLRLYLAQDLLHKILHL